MKYPIVVIVCALAALWFTRPSVSINNCLKHNTAQMCAILEVE